MNRPILPFCALPFLAVVASADATYVNPMVLPIVAHPSVVRAPDGTFYLFATLDRWESGSPDHLIPVFRSKDLVLGNLLVASH